MTLGHESHPQGTYTSTCRACRIGADLDRIAEVGRASDDVVVTTVPREPAFLAMARKYVSRAIWTESALRAMKVAADAGVSLREFMGMAEEATREVAGRK